MQALNNGILITGATSFIGRHLFERLIAERYGVDGISLHGGEIMNHRVMAVDLIKARDVYHLLEAGRYSLIYHLASCRPQSRMLSTQEQYKLRQANIEGMLNLLNAASVCSARVVFASSLSVCAGGNWSRPVTENDRQPRDDYSVAKAIAEDMCESFGRNRGLPVISLRLSSVYGPGDPHRFVMTCFIERAFAGRDIVVHGAGQRTMDFVYIDDVVDLLVAAGRAGNTGIFNIGSGIGTTITELAHAVADIMGHGKMKVIHADAQKAETSYLVADISKAVHFLDYHPKCQTVRDGLKAMARTV